MCLYAPRDQSRIKGAAAEVAHQAGVPHDHILPLVCDVTDEVNIRTALSRTVRQFGGLNILITNAGGPSDGIY